MNLYTILEKRKDEKKPYLITEDASYSVLEIIHFSEQFKKKILDQHEQTIALKIQDQIVLIFCIWACIKYKRSFVLLPHQIDTSLETELLGEISCNTVVTIKKAMEQSITVDHIDSYHVQHSENSKNTSSEASISFISSGTTGKPKLICNTFSQIAKSMHAIKQYNLMPYATNKKVLISPLITHSYGFSVLLEYTLGNSSIIIPRVGSFMGVFNLMAKKKIQTLVDTIEGVPYFYKQLIVFKRKIHFENLKHIGFGGDFVHTSLLNSCCEIYQNLSFSVRYGISEIPSVISINTFKRLEDNDDFGDILPIYEVTLVTDNEIRVCCKDDPTMCVDTGDIGIIEENKLKIVERKASFLKVKGYKISPNYIEKIILDSEMIEDAQLYAKDDQLIVRLVTTDIYEKNSFKNYLKKNLPYYAIPDTMKEVDVIERTNTGKIVRK